MNKLILSLVLLSLISCKTANFTDAAKLEWNPDELIGFTFSIGTRNGDKLHIHEKDAVINSSELFSYFPTKWDIKGDLLILYVETAEETHKRVYRLIKNEPEYFLVNTDKNKPLKLFKLRIIEQGEEADPILHGNFENEPLKL